MRYKAGQREETKRRILQAVYRGFRQHGFDGAGVDGLAKEAGVTSGAFYKHFNSKGAAFRESVALGLEEFTEAVEHFQAQHGEQWLDEFSKFYLGQKRTCDLEDSCALQSLTPEVGRSDEQTRELYQEKLLQAVESFAAGLPSIDSQSDKERTWVYLAMLVGGVSLARAVKDPNLADIIARAIQNALQQNN